MFNVQILAGIDIKGPCILPKKICFHSYYATFTFTNEKIKDPAPEAQANSTI